MPRQAAERSRSNQCSDGGTTCCQATIGGTKGTTKGSTVDLMVSSIDTTTRRNGLATRWTDCRRDSCLDRHKADAVYIFSRHLHRCQGSVAPARGLLLCVSTSSFERMVVPSRRGKGRHSMLSAYGRLKYHHGDEFHTVVDHLKIEPTYLVVFRFWWQTSFVHPGSFASSKNNTFGW